MTKILLTVMFACLSVKSTEAQTFRQIYVVSDKQEAHSLVQTTDGGYAMAGYTFGKGTGDSEFLLVKVDSNGNKQWDKTFGESEWNHGNSLIQTTDGGYAMGGYIFSPSLKKRFEFLSCKSGQMGQFIKFVI